MKSTRAGPTSGSSSMERSLLAGKRGGRHARLLMNAKVLKMKLYKSAAKAALKPNEKVTVTTKTPGAPAPTAPVAASAVTRPAVAASALTRPAATALAVAKPAGTSAALTTIDVKRDVGFGNAVFMRGQGAGLTWERGLPLVCVDAQTWRWSGMAKDPITFKLLINDKIWSAGNDLTIAPGQKIEVAPEFA
jgi:hypothetical protein